MLTIVTGSAGSGKTTVLLERMGKLAEQGRRSILLVPESGSHQYERRLLEICGNPAGQYAAVSTFSKLTEDLLEEAGRAPRTLDAGGRVLTMYRALEECASSLTDYRGAKRPQLVGRLLETAQEMKTCGILPEQLLRAAADESGKLRDLAVIYTAYCGLCGAGELDPADRLDIACDCVEQSLLVRDTAFFLDDFDGFTGNKYPMLEALLRRGAGMTAALLLGEDRQLYQEQYRTLEKLRRLADRAGQPLIEQVCPPRETGASGPRMLSQKLYQYGALPAPGAGVSLYTAGDPAEECELAAAKARQLALSGVRLREMTVVCGDLEEYGNLLENAFARYGIPLFRSEKQDVLQTPALVAALGALSALEDGLRPEALFDWLRCGLCGLGREELDPLENYALLWNIRGGQWLRPFTKATTGYRTAAADEGERLAGLEQTRMRVAALLEPLSEELKACATGDGFAGALAGHLGRMGLRDALEEKMTRLRRSGEERLANEYGQLYRILTEGLAQFGAAMAGRPMERREFLQLLRLLLGQYEVSSIPPSLDSVLAVTFQRMSPWGIRHLFLVGGREGLLPPGNPAAGLLTESERIRLEQLGVELTQSQEGRAFQQQSCLCRVLAAPAESLTMTRPLRGGDGEECRASHVWSRAEMLLAQREQPAEALLRRLRLTAETPAFELACTGAEAPAGAAAEALEHFRRQGKADFFSRLRAYAQAPRGPIRDPRVREALYGKVLRMTASRLERVSTCHFSYFMEYGLKARPREQAQFGAPEVGTFVHDVLEHAIRDLCADPQRMPEAVVAGHVNRYLREQLAGREDSARFRGIYDRLGKNLLEIVKNVWAEIRASQFRPVCFELDFSGKGDLPPLELRQGEITLRLGGKIDRVDGFLQGDTLFLKVVDYKTGTKEFRLSDVLYGLNLQMFLYLLMLEHSDPAQLVKALRLPEEPGAPEQLSCVPAAALYIPTKAPVTASEWDEAPEAVQKKLDDQLRRIGILRSDQALLEALEHTEGAFRFLPVQLKKDGTFDARSCVADAEEMGRLLRRTQEELEKIALCLAAGDVEATPYRKGREFSACEWCDFKTACHFDATMKKDHFRVCRSLGNREVLTQLAEEDPACPAESLSDTPVKGEDADA